MRNGFCVLLPIGYLCVMKKLFTTIYITLLCLDCMAQRQTVVADMDTRLPIAGAVVSTAGGKRLTTDYSGRFRSALPIKSATISKKHYMQRRVSDMELRQDTIFLIPQEVVLNDVVVTAPGFSFNTQKALRSVRENAALPNPAQGFDLLGIVQILVPTKKAKSAERCEKIKKILDRY